MKGNSHVTDMQGYKSSPIDLSRFILCQAKMALEPIALIGISCEFAGGIDRPEALWTVLKDSVDVGSEIPHERFDMDSFAPLYDAKKPYIRRGYFLSNDRLDHFDPSFFGINDGDALSMDPCHRLLLQKFVHLLEDADYPLEKIQGSRTAVFIGQFTTDHSTTLHREKIEHHTHHLGANISLFNASARLSYHFDLRGPNLTLDTACSSSLQAVQLAVQSLRTGEVNLAVAGASNLNYTPEAFFMSMIVGAVSPDGRSRSYSDDANGYAKSKFRLNEEFFNLCSI
jgi:acyl transferase domain-containing protein